MKVLDNEAFQAFLSIADDVALLPTRVKSLRSQPLTPGGRARVVLFERVGGGRPHPRMHIVVPAAKDPSPAQRIFAPASVPSTAKELGDLLRAELSANKKFLSSDDLDLDQAPKGSEKFYKDSIRVQRIAQFFREVGEALKNWEGESIPDSEIAAATAAVREVEDEAYAGSIEFDDANTGTYHSYGHDAPFVHYLEQLLESLPQEGSAAMAVLPSGARESIRRQRTQLQAHLDYLMRHKYAYEVIEETDIEKTLGGLLIDRATRYIVSERPDSDPLTPSYELLRIEPGADHEHAGAWIYADAAGKLFLQDGTPITARDDQVRRAPKRPQDLTFRRANNDPKLRSNIRFDWDGNGHVQQGKIDWVSWAGHCDIKAVMEQLGITLQGAPSVTEYRSDTGMTTKYDRSLLLEMIASTMELGSVYSRLDGTGRIQRGVHKFGGSRNDSRPDRLQFAGPSRGRGFRWPLSGRQEVFRVTGITWDDGSKADLGTAFFRFIPDAEKIEFRPNPRYLKTVEGDHNIANVSGAKIEAEILVDTIDDTTGYLKQDKRKTVIDLTDGARGEHDGRFFLGTHVESATARRVYQVYWDPRAKEIVAELFAHEQVEGKWTAKALPGETVRLPMRSPVTATLSREMKRDNPRQFQALLQLAQREAQNICADTDKEAAVWNGVVTKLAFSKLGVNASAQTERWQVNIVARFGTATLDYLVARGESGEPIEYCPAVSETSGTRWPDFLWRDIPDVGSKGFVDGDWVVNETMVERELVAIKVDDSVPSGFYVFDDHIKNTFELIFCGLAEYKYTIVHANKRYAFTDETKWRDAVGKISGMRAALKFDPPLDGE